MAQPTDRLLGTWRLLRADPALDFAPAVRMNFKPGGRLDYSFETGPTRQAVPLVYRVEGDLLHTESPGTTHEVAAHFEFGGADTLVFDFAGAKAFFVRELDDPGNRASG